MKEIRREDRCPSCGRFCGAYERCPHCGAEIKKRVSVKFFRYFSIVVALAGLFFLYLMAINQEVKVIKAEDITETMNFAYVSIEGKVSAEPRVFEKDGVPTSISIWVDDGTGDIRVTAYRLVAREIKEEMTLPRKGDFLKASGTLRVQPEGNISLIVQSKESLKVKPIPLKKVAISDIDGDYMDQNIVVEGMVSSLSFPEENTAFPMKMTLEDGIRSIQVIAWRDIYTKLMDKKGLDIGAMVEVKGTIGEFRGKPQIQLSRYEDLKVITEGGRGMPPSIALKIRDKVLAPSDISKEMLGDTVTVEGTLKGMWRFSKGVKLTLEGGGKKIDLLFWKGVWEEVSIRDSLIKGAKIRCTGVVKEYKGKLQVQPQSGADITLVKPAPPQRINRVKIGEITRELLKKDVEVEGKVTGRSRFSKGVKLTLNDGTGSIEIVLWDNVYKGIKDGEKIDNGSQLRIKGKVKEYKGRLQVHPASSSGLIIVSLTQMVDLTETDKEGASVTSASLTPAMIGKKVTITGEVVGLKGFSSGTRIDLKDDAGTFQSYIKKKVFESIQGKELIEVGAILKMTGEVEEYRGKIQVNPKSGDSIKVIREGVLRGGERSAQVFSIKDINSSMKGSSVSVKGEITGMKEIRGGRLFNLDDGTGSIILLIWNSVGDKIPAKERLKVGQKVSVTGEVTIYKDKLEIKLKSPNDIQLLD